MSKKFNPTQLDRACLLIQILTTEFRKMEFEFTKKQMDVVILALGEDVVKYFLNFFTTLDDRIKEYYTY